MEATVFNPVQQHLLKMFAYDGSEERLSEVKEVLSRYFSGSWMKVLTRHGNPECSVRNVWMSCGMWTCANI